MDLSSRLLLLLTAFAAAANAGPVLSSLNPPYIQAGGPDVTLTIGGSGFVPGSTVMSYSIALATTAGAATLSFDIQPNAQPFTVAAVGPGATTILQIDPVAGTWQGYVTSPTAVARVGDFSLYNIVVYDLLSGTPFPGNIIPVSRFNPMAAQAASLLPIPSVLPTTPSPNATFAYASRPLKRSGHFSIGSGQASDDLSNLFFGAFVNIGQPPPSNQTAEFQLFVDGVLVATKDVSYPVQ